MSPFRILGLDRKADIPQVKRAYAKLLRAHRPDEDPAGFQRLHEAYEACLEQARWREQGWDDEHDDEDDEGGIAATEPAQDAVTDEPLFAPFDADASAADGVEAAHGDGDITATDGFDAGAFADELLGRMRADTPQAVEAWLQAHDDLYSLDRKRALQPVVVDALDELDAATAARHYETVARFFGMDTVSGTDGWLHHRLDDIQRRFGDAAEFERVLRTHAGAQADWADQTLAKELLHPFSWMRRLFLIACPGLPGRTGALARALRAADPESASSQLNQKASQFWERATARNTLRWERLGFMTARIASWTLMFSSYIALAAQNKGFGEGFLYDWAALFAIPFGIWLTYALVVLGLLRFRDYNQSRMQWDMFLLMTLGGLACGVVSVSLGGSGTIPFIMTTIFWLGGRHPGGQGWSPSQGAALLAGLSSFGLAVLVMHQLAGASIEGRYQACAAVLFAFAAQAVHDLVLSRTRDIPLHVARTQTGWLWPMFGIQIALLFVASMVS